MVIVAAAALLVLFGSSFLAHADDLLRLTADDCLNMLSAPAPREYRARDPLPDRVLAHLKANELGVQPLFMLLPNVPSDSEDPTFPTFAFVARVRGRTLVSLTRPGVKRDPDDRLLLQRLLISDLLQGQQFSLTVYKDQALNRSARQLVGIGARVRYRPPIELSSWRLRLELFSSYEPQHGAAAYLSLSGRLSPPPPVVSTHAGGIPAAVAPSGDPLLLRW